MLEYSEQSCRSAPAGILSMILRMRTLPYIANFKGKINLLLEMAENKKHHRVAGGVFLMKG